jgi:hypothetical protein
MESPGTVVARSRQFKLWGIGASVGLSLILLWGATFGKHVVLIHFDLRSSTDWTLPQDTYVFEDSRVPRFDFHMKSSNPQGGGLYVWIRPWEENTYRQSGPATVVGEDVSWPVQLGSPKWPVIHDESYSFKVADGSERDPSASGEIEATVYALGVGWLWLSGFISAMASFLQIYSFLGQRDP